jgi:hypothetical protein
MAGRPWALCQGGGGCDGHTPVAVCKAGECRCSEDVVKRCEELL